ncbi:MAG: lactate utilization protein C [Actinomycetota bacterium]|jgi:L-lactate dehydrogenase complex protein LldG|nr:lactate utilization protein C [Actinomycetota bacterium]
MSAREEILDRVRRALGPSAGAASFVERGYRQAGSLSVADRLDLIEERLVDYRALVRRCAAGGVDSAVAGALARRGASRLVVPTGLDVRWPTSLDVVVDEGQLSAAELDRCDGVVTGAAVAIAETGTIVLDGSRNQGRRAISLVPDYHLCIVRAEQVVETVPEAVALLKPERAMTWISGPSATSDIELNRVEGVHGPRTLEVILVVD